MGKVFMVGDYGGNPKFLADMGNSGAELFFDLTQAIAEHYNLPSGIADNYGDDSYHMDEKQFCDLVNAVFLEPIDLAYSWAKCAAGMYDIARGRRHIWNWNPEAVPFRIFAPYYYGESPPPADEEEIQCEGGDSVVFVDENDKILASMSAGRAQLFVLIGRAYADRSNKLKFRSGIGDVEQNKCRINSERFCLFTEAVVSSSYDWMYPWTRYAVAMYSIVKDEAHLWAWYPQSVPIGLYDPVYTAPLPSKPCKGKYVTQIRRYEIWQLPADEIHEGEP